MHLKTLPTIASIQRTTAVVALCAGALLLIQVSAASAASYVLGATLMVANLSALSWTVRLMFSLARQASGVSALGLIAAPLKMVLLAGVIYLIIASGRIQLPGFIAGTLTQFAGLFIEVGCASLRTRLFARPY